MVKVVGIIMYQGLRGFWVEQIAVTLRNKNQVCSVTWFFRCYNCYTANFSGEKNGINCLLSLMNRPKTEINIKELSYRQQIARKLHTQYAEGILRVKCYTVTLKSRLKITQGHWIQNNWIDHIISYHLDLLRRHSSNVQQRRTIQ